MLTLTPLASQSAFSAHYHSLQDAPELEDLLPLISRSSGNQCTVFAETSLVSAEAATLDVALPGLPTAAYVIWSGRDRDNLGDNTIRLDDHEITAEIEHHGESGGGSYWHTYAAEVTLLVESLSHISASVSLSVSDLKINENSDGENHGVGLVVTVDSTACSQGETNFHFGLDSFKSTATEPMYGPHSAVQCTTVAPTLERRQVDLSVYIGGIETSDRNGTVWIATTANSIPPATLINTPDALSYVDPVGNIPENQQWDRFSASIELPPNHAHICIQFESIGDEGVSAVLAAMLVQVKTIATIDPYAVKGKIWIDVNLDGNVDADEPGAPNVVVLLRSAIDRTVIRAFVTDETGSYRFSNLGEASYIVDLARELADEEWISTSEPDPLLDTETTITVTNDTVAAPLNFGIVYTSSAGTISGMVWQDTDGDGQRDEASDPGIENVAVVLLDMEQTPIAEQMTTQSGQFVFVGLGSMDYQVTIRDGSIPGDFVQTFESDSTPDRSVNVALAEDAVIGNIEFGFGTKGIVSGRIWLDLNSDGLPSENETGINNALVLLTNDLGVGSVAATQNGGLYQFDNLEPGSYSLQVVPETLPPGLSPSFDPDGTADGMTSFDILISSNLEGVNFGYFAGSSSSTALTPTINVAEADIDLSNGEALLEYLMSNLTALEATDVTGQNSGDSEPNNPTDAPGNGDQPTIEPIAPHPESSGENQNDDEPPLNSSPDEAGPLRSNQDGIILLHLPFIH